MYDINFTDDVVKELDNCLKAERDAKIYKRLQCLNLKRKGYNHNEISDILYVSNNTVTGWLKLFKEQTLKGLRELHYEGRRISKLEAHKKDIKEYVEKEMVQTLGSLQHWLKEKFELEVEQSWLSRWLKKTQFFLQEDNIDSGKSARCRSSGEIRSENNPSDTRCRKHKRCSSFF